MFRKVGDGAGSSGDEADGWEKMQIKKAIKGMKVIRSIWLQEHEGNQTRKAIKVMKQSDQDGYQGHDGNQIKMAIKSMKVIRSRRLSRA